jgi:parallel beta-helix repeat protein
MRFHRGYMVGFLLLAIIIIALPLTIYIAQKPQQTQQQAAGGGTALLVSPHSRDRNPGTQTTPQGAGGGNALYVSPSGRDRNPGTQTAPFATIKKADSVATPGTTVHVAPGTYTWTGITTHSGTATAHITFVSDTKWEAILRPPSISWLWSDGTPGNYIWYVKGSYVDIIGFDIDGSRITSGQDEGLGLAAPYVRAIGNRIHDLLHGDGIYTSGDTGPDDAIGNIVFNIGTPSVVSNQIHGIYFRVANGGRISNNIVSGVSGYGIHCWHACSNTTISNNTVFNNRNGGIIFGGGDAPNFGNSLCDNMVVTNNVAINNTKTGIEEYEYPGQHTIGSHNQILNNIVYGNPDGNMVLLEGNTASGTITSDPHSAVSEDTYLNIP